MLSLSRSSDSIKGIMAMILAALLLTINDALSKWLTQDYSVWQVIALRQAVALALILPYIHWAAGWQKASVNNPPGVALRAAFFVATTALIVTSFSLLPLALVTAIAFSSPIFVVAFSHLFTSEKVGRRRWLAVVVGFLGVVIIVRPGGSAFELALLLPVMAALTSSSRDVVTRWLSRSESSIAILLWSNVAVVLVAFAATTATGWQAVTGPAAALLFINGALNALAHFLVIDALRLGDASLVSPFRYSGLLWSIMLGFAIWGEFPDAWTLAGAAILVASGIYIIERSPRPTKLETEI